MKKNTALSRILLLTALASSTTVIHAQAPLDAEDGIQFGLHPDSPFLKADNTHNLNLDLSNSNFFTLKNSGQTTFISPEIVTSPITTPGWYRIAQTSGPGGGNCSAQFQIFNTSSNSGWSSVMFLASQFLGNAEERSVTLLSHARVANSVPTYSKIRFLDAGPGNTTYLEVKVESPHTAKVLITQNALGNQWQSIPWTASPENISSAHPGYTAREYDIDKLFMVGDTQSRFSIDRGGEAKLNGSRIVTTYNSNGGVAFGGSATHYGSFATGDLSLATALYSVALNDSYASGTFSTSTGAGWADGDWAFATGRSNSLGDYSFSAGLDGRAEATSSIAFSGSISKAFQALTTGHNTPRFTEAGKTAWQGDNLNSAFEVGIGSADNDRKNGLTVLQDGSVEIGHNSTDATIPLHIKADGSVILSKPQGDISMGIYGQP